MSSGRFVAAEVVSSFGELLGQVAGSGEACYVTQNGKAVAVLLDIHRYHQIMDLLEETESLKVQQIGAETRQHITVRGVLQRSRTTRMQRRRQ